MLLKLVLCKYKKLCLKDISQLPKEYKEKIIHILFVEIPQANKITDCRLDIYPIKVRQEAVNRIANAANGRKMPPTPFWVSLPVRALLVTGRCEASGTTWRRP